MLVVPFRNGSIGRIHCLRDEEAAKDSAPCSGFIRRLR